MDALLAAYVVSSASPSTDAYSAFSGGGDSGVVYDDEYDDEYEDPSAALMDDSGDGGDDNYEDGEDDNYDVTVRTTSFGKPGTAAWTLAVAIGTLAAYLSWSCNSALGYPPLEKLLYAAAAFMFGGIYLAYYLLFRSDVACAKAGKR